MNTTPASPSPGTQLLSEEELERALRGVISNFPQHNAADGNAYYRITGRVVEAALAHIAALTAENARLVKDRHDFANEVRQSRAHVIEMQDEAKALTASREEMRGLLMEASDCISGPTLDTTLTQGLTLKLALWRAAQARALSQQPEAQGK